MEEGSYLEGEAALGSTIFGTVEQRNIALERVALIGQLGSGVIPSSDDIKKSNAIVVAPGTEAEAPVPSSDNIKKGNAIVVAPGAEGGAPVNTGEVNSDVLREQLGYAVRQQNPEAVKTIADRLRKKGGLLECVNGFDEDGHTLLHWAAKGGAIDIVNTLVECGAEIEAPSKDAVGMYPIHWACTEGHLRIIIWLLEHGADIDATDKQNCTPLAIAAQYGRAECVIMLVKRGANNEILDMNGDNALHWAAYKGHTAVLASLIRLQMAVEFKDSYGQTALHLASLRGNVDCVEYLILQANANLEATDTCGKTPLGLAIKKGKTDVEMFLRTQGSRNWRQQMMIFWDVVRRPYVLWQMLQTGKGLEGAIWPLISNIFIMLIVTVTLFRWLYIPTFIAEAKWGGHLVSATILALLVVWSLFIVCYFSDPGYVSTSSPELKQGFQRRMDSLMKGESPEDPTESVNLCYTCVIERPLRSKHCRICRRCVSAFDHHCPWIGNCVGGNNFLWFCMYIVLVCLSGILYVATCAMWMWTLGFSLTIFLSAVLIGLLAIMTAILSYYHILLMGMNLTTNEHQNAHRYGYLHNPSLRGSWKQKCGI